MQISTTILATLSLCYGASLSSEQVAQQQSQTEHAMSGYQGSMTNAQQVQDTLNRQLQGNGGAHANQARVNAFITGADSQIDNAIATMSDALAPLTGGLSKDIGNVLLGPFVQSVTNGAEVFLSNLIGGGEDMADAEMTAQLTGNYSKLAALATKNNVDSGKLQNLAQQITNTLPKSKRASDADMSGAKGAMTNAQQVQDTLNRQLQGNGGAHANQARINAFITGADSQIDNAIATVGDFLSPVTGGVSKGIADVLLGPFVQSVTNGAEVFLSNLIGGGEDMADAEMTAQLTGNYSKLAALATKSNVDASKLNNLSQQITNTLPKSH